MTTATRVCPGCDRPLWAAYKGRRVVATLEGLTRFAVQVRRCRDADCPRHNVSLRAEAEGAIALPQQEFGLDVIALVGRLRHVEHRGVAEIHAELTRRGVGICVRSVSCLLDRYDELLALSLSDPARLRRVVAEAGRVILAIDGLQPDVGHEVLWVIRDVLSGEILLARSLLSSCRADLAKLLGEVRSALQPEAEGAAGVPIVGVISDGQHSIRDAVAEALPGVPHQLCQFHYLREAARPIYEADRHAKVTLKKKVRGIRPIERAVEGRDDDEATAIRGYCAAVRTSLTDDGRPPLAASGLVLRDRLAKVAEGLDEVGAKKGLPKELTRLRAILAGGLEATDSAWPEVRAAFGRVHRAAAILRNKAGLDAAGVRRRFVGLMGEIGRHRDAAGGLDDAVGHFLKVTRSYWPGLFACYDTAGLPRTNNDLEQLFGSYRHHERRCSGRKVASPGMVVRGSVRLVSATATRLRPIERADLVPSDLAAWRALRGGLERRQEVRKMGHRFRRDPAAYLLSLKEIMIKPALPS
ncbi:transposase [Paludisphaera mucosa]|uniref:Transposase n=1 Tax=Paludisphaera mucosa TaxID=3030827 RepID=A0ABT6FE75_9BACT|nr:transposase [Paludisphaera mucosa]MDG3005157.1 transposase [Paludisphaera mucosa]MDG3005389.1 transposase [Paludisphaera mucosa]MDG3005874.1 transposase [Paludisphaera mucosa]MDG3005893.1 transposase [Paludisphaera mucosa]